MAGHVSAVRNRPSSDDENHRPEQRHAQTQAYSLSTTKQKWWVCESGQELCKNIVQPNRGPLDVPSTKNILFQEENLEENKSNRLNWVNSWTMSKPFQLKSWIKGEARNAKYFGVVEKKNGVFNPIIFLFSLLATPKIQMFCVLNINATFENLSMVWALTRAVVMSHVPDIFGETALFLESYRVSRIKSVSSQPIRQDWESCATTLNWQSPLETCGIQDYKPAQITDYASFSNWMHVFTVCW